jgi:putative NADH-flavin reductase
MKLVILGATGGIGLELVRQSIERGHQVTALVRRPEPLNSFSNQAKIIQGDVLDPSRLATVLAGHDAIASGFGPRPPIAKAESDLLTRFASSLTIAAQQSRVRRAILVSSAFLFKDAILPPANLLGRMFFGKLVVDATEMERIVRSSDLDWTIVRPPRLNDKPLTGKYRTRVSHLPTMGFQISRANVADFTLNIAENRACIREVVGVSN